MASAPHSLGSLARHLALPPPPHSSENSSLVPSLLNVAECQYEKLESAAASTRLGLAGSRMSSSSPIPSQAPPAMPSAGYTVMSWHWLGPLGGPSPPMRAATMPGRAARSAALSALVGAPAPPRAF